MKKMNTKTIISISEARKRIFDIAEEVQKPSTYYTLTENGRAKAVLMSAEQFDSIMEDLEILSDPKIMANIKEAEEQLKRGEYVTLDELMKEYGYTDADLQPSVVMEKPKKPYTAKAINKSVKKHGSKKNAR
jgi:prevent-host-death family protein